jgi:hypothetical protein
MGNSNAISFTTSHLRISQQHAVKQSFAVVVHFLVCSPWMYIFARMPRFPHHFQPSEALCPKMS